MEGQAKGGPQALPGLTHPWALGAVTPVIAPAAAPLCPGARLHGARCPLRPPSEAGDCEQRNGASPPPPMHRSRADQRRARSGGR